MRTSKTVARSLTRPARAPRTPRSPRIPPFAVVKMFVLASVSIVGCVWALRHYYARADMLARREAPAPRSLAATRDDAGAEIVAPDLELLPPHDPGAK